jgi:N-formylmaleamate deformylase
MNEQQNWRPPRPPAALQSYRTIAELLPAHWSQATVTANGIQQHFYRTGGDKPPLLLLHGIMAGGLTWLRVAQALEPDFDLILVDARGHGGSARVGAAFSAELLVADVAALIQELGLARPGMIGHSLGGVTAALLAADRPGLVRAVVSVDAVWGEQPAMTQATAQSPQYQAWFNSYLAYLAALKTQSHAERMAAAFPYLPPGAAGWPEVEYVSWVEAQAQLDLELVGLGGSLWSAAHPGRPLLALAPQIHTPFLLLTGERGNCDPQTVQQVAAALANGQHREFTGAGHFLHLDQFDRFVAIVREFLQG